MCIQAIFQSINSSLHNWKYWLASVARHGNGSILQVWHGATVVTWFELNVQKERTPSVLYDLIG